MTQALVPAPDVADAPVLYVIFKLAGAEYALPASSVLQMESYAGATVVPGTKPWVAGIIQLRGKVLPVIDLRRRFGLPPAELTMESRVVVGEANGRTVALVTDSAREVARIAPSQLAAPPRLAGDDAESYLTAIAQLGTRAVMVLDFAKVIGEESIDV